MREFLAILCCTNVHFQLGRVQMYTDFHDSSNKPKPSNGTTRYSVVPSLATDPPSPNDVWADGKEKV